MTDWWTRAVASIADWYPGGLLGLMGTVVLLGLVAGLSLQPRGFFRLPRGKGRTDAPRAEVIPEVDDDDEELPQLPLDALRERALRYAAAGDYRSAVREWLRVMIRDLVNRDVIEHHPGWTVTELAHSAGHALPGSGHLLHEAAGIFSEIWYGQREATIESASRMRELADAVSNAAVGHQPVTTITMEAR